MNNGIMIVLSHLSFSFGKNDTDVLHDISFTAPDGSCTVLTGANGAGKSTLVAILAGILTPKSGTAKHTGKLGYLPQDPSLFDDMTVRENLIFFTRLAGTHLPPPEELPFGVGEFSDKRVGELSGGMKKRVSLACVLTGNPDTLLLDEPCAALDISYRAELTETIRTLRRAGKCILYIGHTEEEYRPFCNRRYLLENGKLTDLPM